MSDTEEERRLGRGSAGAEAGADGQEDPDGDEEEEEEEEEEYEFCDAEEAMQCVEMAEQSAPDAGVHDYEALAARKRKALAEERTER